MIVQKSYTELFELNKVSGLYIRKKPDNKISEALKKFSEKQLAKRFEEYNDEIDDLQLNNCLTDDTKKGAIMKDEKGGRMYSVAGEMKLKADIKNLNKKQVEIHSRIVEDIDDLIKELDEYEVEAFSGIIIPAIVEGKTNKKK
ncbi:MAG: hypothetical protein K8R85_11125 [Bacteroidetes bacterium]|nr:hypothetical protein [Bacteroidota bacterium]